MFCGYKQMTVFLKYIVKLKGKRMKILCNKGVRESIPRQIDKQSRGPQGERGLEFSRRKKGQTFFPLYIP